MAKLNAQQLGVARLLYGLARQRGLPHQRALEFVAASYAESRLNPKADNPTTHAHGLFQLLSAGYRRKAQQLGGLENPRANAGAILGDYASFWRSHPGAAPGAAASAVERSGEGARFYSAPLALLSGVGGGRLPPTGAPVGLGQPTPPAPGNPPPDLTPLRQAALQALIGNIGTRTPDTAGFLGALKQYRDAQATASSSARPSVGPVGPAGPRLEAPRMQPSAGIRFTGKPLAGEQPGFLQHLAAAARAAGATKVDVISGYRSPADNARVGGVQRSQHTRGRAVDARAYVPGRGWVPLGTLLRSIAGRYHLRSGDQPGFYRGGRDPNHVDAGI